MTRPSQAKLIHRKRLVAPEPAGHVGYARGHDDDNRAVVRAVAAADLQFAGLALHGPRNAVDKIFKGATLHP